MKVVIDGETVFQGFTWMPDCIRIQQLRLGGGLGGLGGCLAGRLYSLVAVHAGSEHRTTKKTKCGRKTGLLVRNPKCPLF